MSYRGVWTLIKEEWTLPREDRALVEKNGP